jgi:hypothetical protein
MNDGSPALPVLFALPSVEDVARLSAEEKGALRGQLLALLAASLTEPTPPSDRALEPKEAARVLGRGVDWIRRNGTEWHEKLVQEFGIGFIMQPVQNGEVRYSAEGLELLKRYWRGARYG